MRATCGAALQALQAVGASPVARPAAEEAALVTALVAALRQRQHAPAQLVRRYAAEVVSADSRLGPGFLGERQCAGAS